MHGIERRHSMALIDCKDDTAQIDAETFRLMSEWKIVRLPVFRIT